MRNLTKTIVAVSLMTSTSAYSLGIGEIKLRSALNQNLDAEIALFASAGENVSNIQVKLAPPAKFDAAGVPWSYFLSKIRFTPVTKPDGSIVVKLSSTEALKEPFLNFLLEVSWPNGNQFREFTVLVDPPAMDKRKVIPVLAQQEAKQPENRLVTPDDYNKPMPVIARPVEVPANDVIESDPVSEYGPVRRSDTLWSIANRVRAEGVTAAQMAVAIYEANPGAFAKPNMNTLRSGETLSIPEPGVALQTPHRQAITEFKQHRKIYRQEARQVEAARRAAARPPAPKVTAEDVQPTPVQPAEAANNPVAETPQLPVVTQPAPAPKPSAEAKPVIEEAAKPVNQLKLEPPVESAAVEKNAAGSSNKAESDQVDPAVVAMTTAKKQELAKEAQEFEQRFQRIEQQLVMMQKMLEIKNEQLSSLQNANLQLPADANAKTTLIAEPQQPAQPATMQSSPVVPSAPATASEPVPAPKPVTQPPKPVVTPPVNMTAANSFADYYLLGGGLAALLGALGLLWWRKRKEVYEDDLDDMFATSSQMNFTPDGEDAFEAVKMEHSSAYDVGMVSESAFLSEFTPSEFDAFDSGQTEIDPISEADVYLAYGRFQQAEDLIRQAIADQPERNECKLKLLEIFYVNENKLAFDNYVQELIQQGKQSEPAFWDKVVEMANVLSPGAEDLLKAATLPAASARSGIHAVNDPLDFDLSSFSISSAANDNASANEKPEASRNMHLSSVAAANMGSDGKAEAERNNNSLDFDLSLFAAKTEDEPTSQTGLGLPDDPHSLDFDLGGFALTATAEDEAHQLSFAKERQALEFDFNALSATENEIQLADGEADFNVMDLDGLNIEFIPLADDLPHEVKENTNDKFEYELPLLAGNQAQDTEALDALSEDSSFASFDLNDFASIAGQDKDSTVIELSLDNDSEASLPVELENFEFDFTLDDVADDSSELSYDLAAEQELGDFDFSLESMLGDDKAGVALQSDDQVESFDFTLPDAGDVTEQTAKTDNFNVDDLTDGSGALDTKINLANAYIDMGDIDAARGIAEVLLKGPKQHKQAGREILAKIS